MSTQEEKLVMEDFWDAGEDTILKHGIVCYPGNCLHQAIKNMTNDYWASKNLHIVVGSVTVAGYALYAPNGKHRNTSDYHVWLENNDGRVYDIVTPIMLKYALLKNVTIQYDSYHILDGVTQNEMKIKGLVFVPTPDTVVSIDENIRMTIADHILSIETSYPGKLLKKTKVPAF